MVRAPELRPPVAFKIIKQGSPLQYRKIRRIRSAPKRPKRLLFWVFYLRSPKTIKISGIGKIEVAKIDSPEKFRTLLMKILELPKPSIGIKQLQKAHLLGRYLPEMMEGMGIAQNPHHAFDVFGHLLDVCDQCPGPSLLRLAALFHDIGKPRKRRYRKNQFSFDGHPEEGARMADYIMKRLGFSVEDRNYVCHLVRYHMVPLEPDCENKHLIRFIYKVGQEHLSDIFQLRRADRRGPGRKTPAIEKLPIIEARLAALSIPPKPIKVHDLAVTGKDIMRILKIRAPGPQIGRIKEELYRRVEEDRNLNTQEQLEKIIRETNWEE